MSSGFRGKKIRPARCKLRILKGLSEYLDKNSHLPRNKLQYDLNNVKDKGELSFSAGLLL